MLSTVHILEITHVPNNPNRLWRIQARRFQVANTKSELDVCIQCGKGSR